MTQILLTQLKPAQKKKEKGVRIIAYMYQQDQKNANKSNT